MNTQFDKEYLITLIREIFPNDIDKITDDEKIRIKSIVRDNLHQHGVNDITEILKFYNDLNFRKQRKSRIGEILYRKLMKIEFEALTFFFPEFEGMILSDAELNKGSFDVNKVINWSGVSRLLANDRTIVSQNRIPQKYQSKIDRLKKLIQQWQNESVSDGG